MNTEEGLNIAAMVERDKADQWEMIDTLKKEVDILRNEVQLLRLQVVGDEDL